MFINNLLIKNIWRRKMQQRFCSVCGFPVWVQYRLHKNGSNTVFWSRNDLMAETLAKCPCCWERIDIDMLA
jgi:hypothetical protein